MKGFALIPFAFLFLYVFLHALDYVESSSGLQNPQWESGRTELELADINGDGNIDILSIGDHGSPYIGTQEHGIMVWFGDGAGNWSVFQNGNFGYGGIAVGDLNNDGFPDVGYGMHHNYSSTDFGDSILEAALGDGTGQNWQPWDDGISTGNPDQWGMFCTDLADINNDGLLDLGANSFGSGDGIHIFLNNGDGTWTGCFGFLGGNSTMEFSFGDVNGDGNADFAAAHQYGTVYLGDGAGGFVLADGNLPSAGIMGRYGPSLGDINNDGAQDLAFRNANGGVEVYIYQGNSTWLDVSGTLPGSGSFSATQLCDMNIDGYMDVVAFGSGTTQVWLGDGGSSWTATASFATPQPGTYSAFRVGPDGDHNGYPDIALVAKEGDTWSAINNLRFFKETSVAESLFVFPVYPRGNETFRNGSVRFIDWTCGVPAGETACITLELSTTGPAGPWFVIAGNLPNNCRFQYTVPQGISSANCYIRYTAATSSDTSSAITSAAFTIGSGAGIDAGPASRTAQGRGLLVRPSVGAGLFAVHVSTSGTDRKRVSVYDCRGGLVRDLVTVVGSGDFVIPWNRKDARGRAVAPGTYFVVFDGETRQENVKIVVID
ncbi:VCBS repeat-containing protein [candidate division WOR-3 bacterium]|nr:VCBS repeat-containing protein [candidate division WOR-3 bacterium]